MGLSSPTPASITSVVGVGNGLTLAWGDGVGRARGERVQAAGAAASRAHMSAALEVNRPSGMLHCTAAGRGRGTLGGVRGFVLGLCVGALLGAGGVWLALRDRAAPRGAVTVAPGADAGVAAGKKKKRGGARGGGGGGMGGGEAGEAGDEPAPVLGPADLRMTAEGDSLSRGAQNLDFAAGGEEPRELTQGEINGAMSGVQGAIGECIVNATGNAELSGRINAGVVVGPDGRVTQTRVEAPAYLMKRGLASCVRARLRGLRFPSTGKESVVKYPFTVG